MPASLIVSKKDHILQLTISHPEKKNALTPLLLERIIEVFSQEANNAAPPRVAVFVGEGDIFSSGFDLTALPKNQEGAPPDDLVMKAMQAIEAAPFPCVAAMSGSAFGAAFELACTCDLR